MKKERKKESREGRKVREGPFLRKYVICDMYDVVDCINYIYIHTWLHVTYS